MVAYLRTRLIGLDLDAETAYNSPKTEIGRGQNHGRQIKKEIVLSRESRSTRTLCRDRPELYLWRGSVRRGDVRKLCALSERS
jgi:hypothetical protein